MKKALIIASLTIALAFYAAPRYLGFSLIHIGDAFRVFTGIGAKLACSGHFISGFSPELAISDIRSYSGLADYLEVDVDDQGKSVSVSMLGMSETRARYRDGLGCVLEFGDSAVLDAIEPANMTAMDEEWLQSEWPQGERVSGIRPEVQSAVKEIVAADNTQGHQTRALLVVQDGRVVAEGYAEGITPQTPLMGWSMGKSVTSMLIGRLHRLQGVDFQQAALFPQWRDERASITLENLLQMSSGLEFDETYAPGSDSTRMLFTEPSASDVALESSLQFAPGTHHSYSSGTTNIISRWLFQRVGDSAQSMFGFIHRELYQPLGMRHTVLEPDPSGVPVGSSYIYASARDWGRLGQLMLNNGEWNGEQLLEADWVRRATEPNNSDNYRAYGYQFWLNRGDEALRWPGLPGDAYFMSGNRAQSVMIVPSANAVVVRLGWSSGRYPMADNFRRILDTLSAGQG